MFQKWNIVKIQIHLKKSNADNDPVITIKFGEVIKIEKLDSIDKKIYLDDLQHDKDTKLVIERNDSNIYSTQQPYHENNIIIEKVIVDDFWEFNESFYTPIGVLDDDYRNYLEKIGKISLIEKQLVYNTHLFFNGRFEWEIKYPVRRCFFKDFER